MKRKSKTPRQNTAGEKEEKEMDFIFCEQRKGHRISKAVCEANVKRGRCTQDLLKCRKARTPKATIDERYLDPFSKEIMRQKIKDQTQEEFIDRELDKERKADPLHPTNRKATEPEQITISSDLKDFEPIKHLLEPGEEKVLLDSEKTIQFDLFPERKAE